MDLSKPIRSVIPSGHGAVLAVLAGTERPLSGRRVGELAGDRLSQSRANEVLRELAAAGVVLSEEQPPARLYVLNREHVAADAILGLARMRQTLLDRMRARVGTWEPAPASAWLFGSFARGEGDVHSDIDVLVVRPDEVSQEDPTWDAQVDAFATAVQRWAGNHCSVVEYSEPELTDLVERDERLAAELRRDGVHLGGRVDRLARVPTR
ncbi:MAG: nucleotidyltransferase domain-containing protein [Acidimicrobiales bacterium]